MADGDKISTSYERLWNAVVDSNRWWMLVKAANGSGRGIVEPTTKM